MERILFYTFLSSLLLLFTYFLIDFVWNEISPYWFAPIIVKIAGYQVLKAVSCPEDYFVKDCFNIVAYGMYEDNKRCLVGPTLLYPAEVKIENIHHLKIGDEYELHPDSKDPHYCLPKLSTNVGLKLSGMIIVVLAGWVIVMFTALVITIHDINEAKISNSRRSIRLTSNNVVNIPNESAPGSLNIRKRSGPNPQSES